MQRAVVVVVVADGVHCRPALPGSCPPFVGPHNRVMPDKDDSSLQVRLLDDMLIVVDKPAGLPCVPMRSPRQHDDCLEQRVQARWADALVVHRLDMATSGLVAFARGKAAQRSLAMAFASRTVDKRYAAVVEGRPAAVDGDGTATATTAGGKSPCRWPPTGRTGRGSRSRRRAASRR